MVENQPGANGGLAAGQVARAAPDGYTLFMAVDTNLVVNPNLYPNLAYDPFRDFIPISIIAKVYLVLVASSKTEATSVQELLAFARAHPGGVDMTTVSLTIQQLSDDDMDEAIKGMERAAKQLASFDVDLIYQSGVPPVVRRGSGFGDELADRLSQASGLPAITDMSSVSTPCAPRSSRPWPWPRRSSNSSTIG